MSFAVDVSVGLVVSAAVAVPFVGDGTVDVLDLCELLVRRVLEVFGVVVPELPTTLQKDL